MWYEFRSRFDRSNRTLEVHGHNTTLRDFMVCNEQMRLIVHPDNPMKCKLTYHTSYEVFASSSFIKSQIESLAVSVYARALKSGRQMDNTFIEAYKRDKELNDLPLTKSELHARKVCAPRIIETVSAESILVPPDVDDRNQPPDSGTGSDNRLDLDETPPTTTAAVITTTTTTVAAVPTIPTMPSPPHIINHTPLQLNSQPSTPLKITTTAHDLPPLPCVTIADLCQPDQTLVTSL